MENTTSKNSEGKNKRKHAESRWNTIEERSKDLQFISRKQLSDQTQRNRHGFIELFKDFLLTFFPEALERIAPENIPETDLCVFNLSVRQNQEVARALFNNSKWCICRSDLWPRPAYKYKRAIVFQKDDAIEDHDALKIEWDNVENEIQMSEDRDTWVLRRKLHRLYKINLDTITARHFAWHTAGLKRHGRSKICAIKGTSIANHRNAFVEYAKACNKPLDERFLEELKKLLTNYKKSTKDDEDNGEFRIQQGSLGQDGGFFEFECEFLFKRGRRDDILHLLQSLLSWSLICRPCRIFHLKLEDLEWKLDMLVQRQAKAKNDPKGDIFTDDRHMCGNAEKPYLCIVTVLAVYLMLFPIKEDEYLFPSNYRIAAEKEEGEEEYGDEANNTTPQQKKKKILRTSKSGSYMKYMREHVYKDPVFQTYLKNSCIDIGRYSAYMKRKGARNHAGSGALSECSIEHIELRMCHTCNLTRRKTQVGSKETYQGYNPKADQHIARVLAMNDEGNVWKFLSSTPFFRPEKILEMKIDLSKVLKVAFKPLYLSGEPSMNTKKILKFGLAAYIWHYKTGNIKGLQVKNCIKNIPLNSDDTGILEVLTSEDLIITTYDPSQTPWQCISGISKANAQAIHFYEYLKKRDEKDAKNHEMLLAKIDAVIPDSCTTLTLGGLNERLAEHLKDYANMLKTSNEENKKYLAQLLAYHEKDNNKTNNVGDISTDSRGSTRGATGNSFKWPDNAIYDYGRNKKSRNMLSPLLPYNYEWPSLELYACLMLWEIGDVQCNSNNQPERKTDPFRFIHRNSCSKKATADALSYLRCLCEFFYKWTNGESLVENYQSVIAPTLKQLLCTSDKRGMCPKKMKITTLYKKKRQILAAYNPPPPETAEVDFVSQIVTI